MLECDVASRNLRLQVGFVRLCANGVWDVARRLIQRSDLIDMLLRTYSSSRLGRACPRGRPAISTWAYGGGRGGRGGRGGGMDNSELIMGPGGVVMTRDEAQRQQQQARRGIIIPGGRSPSQNKGAPGQLIIPDQQSGGVAGMLDIGDR